MFSFTWWEWGSGGYVGVIWVGIMGLDGMKLFWKGVVNMRTKMRRQRTCPDSTCSAWMSLSTSIIFATRASGGWHSSSAIVIWRVNCFFLSNNSIGTIKRGGGEVKLLGGWRGEVRKRRRWGEVVGRLKRLKRWSEEQEEVRWSCWEVEEVEEVRWSCWEVEEVKWRRGGGEVKWLINLTLGYCQQMEASTNGV